MLAAHAAAADLEVVDEEGQGDLVELLDDERVGEPAREGHQVVGGDGAGDGDLHARRTYPAARRRGTEPDAPRPAAPAAQGAGRVGPGRPRRCAGLDGQLKQSPQAQELPALGLSMVKPCFSMVSAKSIVAPSR